MIHISNEHRSARSVSAADFTVEFNPPVEARGPLKLRLIELPQSAYNIGDNSDAFLDITYDGTPDVADLTPGFYANGADLASHIETRLQADVSATLTCVYDDTTSRITIGSPVSD